MAVSVEISILNMWKTFVKREVIHMLRRKKIKVFHFVHKDERDFKFCEEEQKYGLYNDQIQS